MTRAFLILAIIFYVIVGLALLAIPVTFMHLFGLTLGGPAVLMARFFAAAELSLAVTLVLMLRDTTSVAARALLLGQALYNIGAIVVMLLAIMAGQLESPGAILVILHAILAASFAWTWFDAGSRR